MNNSLKNFYKHINNILARHYLRGSFRSNHSVVFHLIAVLKMSENCQIKVSGGILYAALHLIICIFTFRTSLQLKVLAFFYLKLQNNINL